MFSYYTTYIIKLKYEALFSRVNYITTFSFKTQNTYESFNI